MKISTNYSSPHLVLKTETSLNKTAATSKIKTDITEGNLMKDDAAFGAVTGNLEVAVNNGVLSTGVADLLVSSASQKLKLTANVTPKEDSFDVSLNLDRSFDVPQDAMGKFVGTLNITANDVKVKGSIKSFEGVLPVQVKAPLLTNGKTAIRDLNTGADLKFSCADNKCSVWLTKPMKFAFANMQTTALYKQIKFFNPIELTINPDSKEPF